MKVTIEKADDIVLSSKPLHIIAGAKIPFQISCIFPADRMKLPTNAGTKKWEGAYQQLPILLLHALPQKGQNL